MNKGTPPEWQVYLALIGLLALVAVVTARLPSYWRRPNKNLERTPRFWVWGDALYRGLIVRSFLLLPLFWVSALPVVLYSVIVGQANVSPALFWGWFVLFTAQVTAWATIALLNWPKGLVPPYLRGEPGALETWARQAPRWPRILRAVPSMFIAWTAWMAIVVYVASRPAREISPIINAGLLAAFFAACALVLAVILFGRPRWLVPPYLRDGPTIPVSPRAPAAPRTRGSA